MKMKTTRLLNSLIALLVGIILFVPNSALAAAFGMSPPQIENNNLKPGASFIYVIDLSANEMPGDMIVETELMGDPEVAGWLTVQNKNSLVMAEGKSMVPMSVAVNIPKDAKVGNYEGTLSLTLGPKTTKPDTVAVTFGGNIAIKLNIINYDVTDYVVQSIEADTANEDQAIDLQMRVKNIGNTVLTDVSTDVSIINMKSGEEVASGSAEKLDVPVQPHTIGETTLPVMIPNLKEGKYYLNVESFKNGASIYEGRITLTVGPALTSNTVSTAVEVGDESQLRSASNGSSTNVKTSVKVVAPMTNQLIVIIIGILLVLTGVIVKIYMHLKKKRR